MGKELFDFLNRLNTEQRNPATVAIDIASSEEIVALISQEDRKVADAVLEKQEQIAVAIEWVKTALEAGGRLIYVGAGTSGRLGVLDAAECPPTFGTDPAQIVGLIAGGKAAMFEAQEGAEDAPEYGKRDLIALTVQPHDIVCGLAASGRTPYVWGALDFAAESGCKTILICCVPADQLPERKRPDLVIDVVTGPEVIMGSTRMKSGTAQKMVCNMITTGAMIRLGKVYENVMVDLKLTNKKLVERAIRIIMLFTQISYEDACRVLNEAEGHVKTAIVMSRTGLDRKSSQELLKSTGGFISKSLNSIPLNP